MKLKAVYHKDAFQTRKEMQQRKQRKSFNSRQLSVALNRLDDELPVHNPWGYLALGIIAQAEIDLKHMDELGTDWYDDNKNTVWRNEIRTFYGSDWLEKLASATPHTAKEFIEAAGLVIKED